MRKFGNIVKVLAAVAAVLLMASCGSSRKFVYLNDMVPGESYPINVESGTVVHVNDRLDIKVSCKNLELAVPFNTQTGAYQVSTDGSVKTAGVDLAEKGYRVDADGNIVFPILGKINVEGKSIKEVSELIESMIEEGNYIKDPEVSIEFLNFKYTVLGAAGAGTYNVEGDRITLLEAIAKAGDLGTNARVNRVQVIREEDGVRKVYEHDLRSKDVFESPAYYLQQNDIVYVVPKYKKKDTEDRAFQYGSLVLSVFASICSLLWVLK